MSVKALTWAIEQRIGDQGAKLLLICLANYAGADHTCYPSREALAEDTETSVSTVKRNLLWLAERGLLTSEARFRENGRQTSNLYRLAVGGQIEPVVRARGEGVKLNPREGVDSRSAYEPSERNQGATEEEVRFSTEEVRIPQTLPGKGTPQPRVDNPYRYGRTRREIIHLLRHGQRANWTALDIQTGLGATDWKSIKAVTNAIERLLRAKELRRVERGEYALGSVVQ